MTLAQTGAYDSLEFPLIHSMKFLRNTAVLLGLAAGSLAIAPQQAHADTCTTLTSVSASYTLTSAGFTNLTCTVGDKSYTFGPSSTNFIFPAGTQILFDQNLSDAAFHTVRVLPAGGALGAGTYVFNYDIAISSSPETLFQWGTGAQNSQNTPNYTLTTTTTSSLDSPAVINGNGSDNLNNYVGNPTFASWTNTISVGSGGAVGPDGITNSVTQTPGPVAILGAGTAFGFSRKLRRRIKSSV